jgi:hypothetical protein
MEVVGRLHQQYSIRIHAIQIEGDDKRVAAPHKKQTPLLQQIATRTGGTYSWRRENAATASFSSRKDEKPRERIRAIGARLCEPQQLNH